MKVKITARHFKAKESLKKYATEKIEELERYNENILNSEVILFYDKPPLNTKYCEIILKLKDKILTCTEGSDEFTLSVDRAQEKIKTQIYKYKDKIKSKKYSKQKRIIKTI
ncbi:MAG: ribosome-associated translation inhibitor RaiA [Ignavibacteria bacterium]|nr:ribosome-associated translation inhibitor RaiA [Ignavibacteria bacterium]